KNAPSIIFIDELDSIAPKRENTTGEVERRVVAQLLGMMDGLQGRGKIIVIGATNRVDSLDPALRRPGRFDREIELGVPDRDGRMEIFQIHTRGMPLTIDVHLDEYADTTHGFVGADIMAVCREAAMDSLRKILPEIDLDKPIPIEVLEKLVVSDDNFQKAISMIEPSAMREIRIDIPDTNWEDIGGLEDVRQELREAVEWPLKYPHLYKKAGIRTMNGLLLFGPPGCGKTLLAKALAHESEINFLAIKGPELFDKFVGETEKAIRDRFKKARQAAPSIIYFDEFDSVASTRGGGYGDAGSKLGDQVVNQILVEMDGLEDRKNVVIIASTNRLDKIDKALLRPGRFDRILHVPAPNKDGRLKILKVHTEGKMPLSQDALDYLPLLANNTEFYSGADLENICREAGMQAIREKFEDFDTVERRHFEAARDKIDPSLTEKIVKEYSKMAEEFATIRSKIDKRGDRLYS
ncbi:MAG: AAA family ATPase, partial [archaeon]|nr:AAA family ATPase [archaeon]